MRFDPRSLLLGWFLVSLLILTAAPWDLICWSIGTTAWLLWHQDHRRSWVRMIRTLWLYLGISCSLLLLHYDLEIVAWLNLRLLVLFSLSIICFTLINPSDLSTALINSHIPPQFAWMLEGSFRSIGLLSQIIQTTIQAQTMRGIRLQGWYLVRNGPALIVPVIMRTVQTAEQLTEALEARGFSSPTRTALYDFQFQWHDWLIILVPVVWLIAF